MNQLQNVFNYEGQQVRTVVRENKLWFVAKDVCGVLGISNHKDAVSRFNKNMKSVVGVSDPHGRVQSTIVIAEPGIYKLVFRSNKPEAEKFTDWIAEEVLPEIRQTGQYGGKKLPGNYKEALIELVKTIEENEKLQPKAEMYDILLSGDNTQTMAQVAKSFGWGRNKLFAYLREKKILLKNNLPYQKYIDNECFEVREVSTFRGDKTINVTQTMVTSKGIDLIGKVLNTRLEVVS